jgi:hypothetical protein
MPDCNNDAVARGSWGPLIGFVNGQMPDFLAKFLQGFRFHGCMVSERGPECVGLRQNCLNAPFAFPPSLTLVGLPVAASWAETPSTAFTQSLATAAAEDAAIAEWYREHRVRASVDRGG